MCVTLDPNMEINQKQVLSAGKDVTREEWKVGPSYVDLSQAIW